MGGVISINFKGGWYNLPLIKEPKTISSKLLRWIFFFSLIYMKEKDEVHFEIKKKKEKKYGTEN